MSGAGMRWWKVTQDFCIAHRPSDSCSKRDSVKHERNSLSSENKDAALCELIQIAEQLLEPARREDGGSCAPVSVPECHRIVEGMTADGRPVLGGVTGTADNHVQDRQHQNKAWKEAIARSAWKVADVPSCTPTTVMSVDEEVASLASSSLPAHKRATNQSVHTTERCQPSAHIVFGASALPCETQLAPFSLQGARVLATVASLANVKAMFPSVVSVQPSVVISRNPLSFADLASCVQPSCLVVGNVSKSFFDNLVAVLDNKEDVTDTKSLLRFKKCSECGHFQSRNMWSGSACSACKQVPKDWAVEKPRSLVIRGSAHHLELQRSQSSNKGLLLAMSRNFCAGVCVLLHGGNSAILEATHQVIEASRRMKPKLDLLDVLKAKCTSGGRLPTSIRRLVANEGSENRALKAPESKIIDATQDNNDEAAYIADFVEAVCTQQRTGSALHSNANVGEATGKSHHNHRESCRKRLLLYSAHHRVVRVDIMPFGKASSQTAASPHGAASSPSSASNADSCLPQTCKGYLSDSSDGSTSQISDCTTGTQPASVSRSATDDALPPTATHLVVRCSASSCNELPATADISSCCVPFVWFLQLLLSGNSAHTAKCGHPLIDCTFELRKEAVGTVCLKASRAIESRVKIPPISVPYDDRAQVAFLESERKDLMQSIDRGYAEVDKALRASEWRGNAPSQPHRWAALKKRFSQTRPVSPIAGDGQPQQNATSSSMSAKMPVPLLPRTPPSQFGVDSADAAMHALLERPKSATPPPHFLPQPSSQGAARETLSETYFACPRQDPVLATLQPPSIQSTAELNDSQKSLVEVLSPTLFAERQKALASVDQTRKDFDRDHAKCISKFNDMRYSIHRDLYEWARKIAKLAPWTAPIPLPLSFQHLDLGEPALPFTVFVRPTEPMSLLAHTLCSVSHYKAMEVLGEEADRCSGQSGTEHLSGKSPSVFSPTSSSSSGSFRELPAARSWSQSELLHILTQEKHRNISTKHYSRDREEKTSHQYTVTVFYARQFFALRQLLGNEEELIASMSRCRGYTPSGGASGSQFLKSQDGRLIAKEITPGQLDHFKSTAQEFFGYMGAIVSKRVVSAMAKILGVFHISGPATKEATAWVLQENLLYGHGAVSNPGNAEVPYGIFDLKGASWHRLAKKGSPVGLDGDLTRLLNKGKLVFLPHGDEVLLHKAVHNDSLMLSRCAVMDYSLLALIHQDGTLTVGIIDYLQAYTKKKQAEALVKGMIVDAPCAVNPLKYRDRFRAAVAAYFISFNHVDASREGQHVGPINGGESAG
ncbi:hypothetical protein DIPPA_54953 [Diplonema papillatum]|nr:hypothetical protein DIPPA_54953 [Diplonema papillatum]